MSLLSTILLILLIIPAASYGWGMRGTTIGGEKGAMLPGALIGAIVALTSDILIVQEYFYVFAALGAIAMYFGGCMTYGETLGLSMNAKPAENMKKGLQGVFLKGFLWFGVFGAIFTTGIYAVTKIYNTFDLIILCILTPALALVCLKIFNKPHDVSQHKFPKRYFSKKRQEYWGAMVGILASLLVFAIIRYNAYTIVFTIICALFGGFGWVVSQLLQIYIIHYGKKSRYKICRLFSSANGADSWKAMECALGAIGGIGVALAHIVTYNHFKDIVFTLEETGGVFPNNSVVSLVLFILWGILFVLDNIHYFVKKPVTKDMLLSQLKNGEISKREYGIRVINAVDTIPKFYDIYEKALEPVEFIIYAAIPFALICLGCIKIASTMALLILFWVLAQEIAFEGKLSKKLSVILQIIFYLFALGLFIYQLICSFRISLTPVFVVYTIVYEVLTLFYVIGRIAMDKWITDDVSTKENVARCFKAVIKNKGLITTHLYFIACISVLLSYCFSL